MDKNASVIKKKDGIAMNDLVEIKNNQVVVSSRQVAESFSKQHKNVIQSIQDILTSSEKSANLFCETTLPDTYGRLQKIYLMNRDGFTLLAMGFTGKEALQWKMKYIEAFNEMEERLNRQTLALPNFKNPAEAARAWAEEFDKRQMVEKQLEEAKPKCIFADAVATAKTSILIGDLAKLIKQNGYDIGQKRLFAWLRENGYLIKNGSSKNSPTQRAMDMALFEIKETTVVLPNESTKITKTTKVTGKGQIYFVNLFKKAGGLVGL